MKFFTLSYVLTMMIAFMGGGIVVVAQTPTNDACSRAITITNPVGFTAITGDTTVATNSALTVGGSCSTFGAGNFPTRWYQFTNPLLRNLSVTLSTCNSATLTDTAIYVYSGSSCTSLVCQARNDDSQDPFCYLQFSRLTFTALPQTTYYIAVATVFRGTGAFRMSFTGIAAPTSAPTKAPTKMPTKAPTKMPTKAPTKMPTKMPTKAPTKMPTKMPTKAPTKMPTSMPTKTPTSMPTKSPTSMPTKAPSNSPSNVPSISPTEKPSVVPTNDPSRTPTVIPTIEPTNIPSFHPTNIPSISPTSFPSSMPVRDCTVVWNIYNSRTDQFVTTINGTMIITNTPPCRRLNIEAVIPCRTMIDEQKGVFIELYRGRSRIHTRREYYVPYFLFGNSVSDIFDGIKIPRGTYSIRVTYNDGQITSPFTNFTLGGSCN